MTAARVTVVEDEPDIAELLRWNLEREGLAVSVERRGDAALEAIRREPPDLVLLDLMLPGLDGLEVTRALRRDPATARLPIIMLTARGEEIDRVVGLELGADDYVTKPFSPREVALRVKAVLRRAAEAGGDDCGVARRTLAAGGVEIDVDGHRVRVRGSEVELTATEFRLLRVLVERRGRVQSRARLLADVWGYADDVESRTVDSHVRRLRKKLGAEAERLETLIGVGYRFNAD